MVCLLTLAAVAFIVILVLLFAIITSDGDLQLMFKARFGKQPESLVGKVVWITGASSGIGEHIAYNLAKAGCRLVLSSRRREELESVKRKCLQISKGKLSESDVLVLPLDVVAFETHKTAVQQVLEYFNRIDILVNNAGRAQNADWLEVELTVDRELFETNVLGPVSLTQEVLPHMLKRKQGHVVVISSVAGKFGAPTFRSYVGSKFAVHGYFESLRTEKGAHNIDVTIVCPGPVVSNIQNVAATGKPGEISEEMKNNQSRMMSTERCAYLIGVSIANKLYEPWVAEHLPLAIMYVYQYCPDLVRWVLKNYGVTLNERMKKGKH